VKLAPIAIGVLATASDRPDNIPFPNRRAGKLFNPWQMLIKLRKKSVQFIGQEERAAYSNINCSMRATETEENVVTIGIPLCAFVE
jgi:hypothetical protein